MSPLFRRRREPDMSRLDELAQEHVSTSATLELATLLTEAQEDEEEWVDEGQVQVLDDDGDQMPGYMLLTTRRVLWSDVADSDVKSMEIASVMGIDADRPDRTVTGIRTVDVAAWRAWCDADQQDDDLHDQMADTIEQHRFVFPEASTLPRNIRDLLGTRGDL